MKCPDCEKEDKKSKVYPGMITRTLMGFHRYHDENGKYHFHDPNITTMEYVCSNGHEWKEKTHNQCWCQMPEWQHKNE